MQKRLSIDLVFDEVSADPEFPEDGSWYDLSKVMLSYSEIEPIQRAAIAESWAQSDFGYINLPNAIFEAIGDGEAVEFK